MTINDLTKTKFWLLISVTVAFIFGTCMGFANHPATQQPQKPSAELFMPTPTALPDCDTVPPAFRIIDESICK